MMKIKVPQNDRIVYVWLNDKIEVTGFNFHQGMDEEYKEFQVPDQSLFEIFKAKALTDSHASQLDLMSSAIDTHLERELLREDIMTILRNARYLGRIDAYIKDRDLTSQDLENIMANDQFLQTLINDIIK